MSHSFFSSLVRSRYLSFFSHSFSFILWSSGTVRSTILIKSLFFFCWLLLGLVFWPRLVDPSVCQSPKGVYVCHFLGLVLDCAYTIFFCMVKFLFLAHLPVDHLADPVVSSLILLLCLFAAFAYYLCNHIA